MRMCTKKILVENGFEIIESANGLEAIWESEPDLELMGITEPGKEDQEDRHPAPTIP